MSPPNVNWCRETPWPPSGRLIPGELFLYGLSVVIYIGAEGVLVSARHSNHDNLVNKGHRCACGGWMQDRHLNETKGSDKRWKATAEMDESAPASRCAPLPVWQAWCDNKSPNSLVWHVVGLERLNEPARVCSKHTHTHISLNGLMNYFLSDVISRWRQCNVKELNPF